MVPAFRVSTTLPRVYNVREVGGGSLTRLLTRERTEC